MEELKENLKAELLKIGIRNESDLQEAIRNLPPLNLSVMTNKAVTEGNINGRERKQDLCGRF